MEGGCVVVAVGAVDGLTDRLLAQAAALAGPVRPVVVVHVTEAASRSLLDPLHDALDRVEAHRQGEVEAAVRGHVTAHALFGAQWRYEALLSDGRELPAALLHRFATQHGACVLVVGHRQAGGRFRVFGSRRAAPTWWTACCSVATR